MLPLTVVSILVWMVKVLYIGVVGANDKILHVIHAGLFESAKDVSVSCTESWPNSQAYQNEG